MSPIQGGSWDAPKQGNSAYAMFKKHMIEKNRMEQAAANASPKAVRDTLNVTDIRNGLNMGEWGQNSTAVDALGSPKLYNTIGTKTLAGKMPS